MEARAHLRFARISPRKVSIVLDLIRNKPVEYAMAVLKNTPKAACEYLGVKRCSVSSCCHKGYKCKGYKITKMDKED